MYTTKFISEVHLNTIMNKEFLKDLGLTDSEVEIYLILLQNDSMLPGNISQKTGIHRPYVYDGLSRLSNKGLVNYVIKSGKKYYRAASPKRLSAIIKEKQDNLNTLLPELNEQFYQKKEDYKVNIFEGKEGLKTLFEMIIEDIEKGEVKELLNLGGMGQSWDLLRYYLPKLAENVFKLIEDKNVSLKSLWNKTIKNKSQNLIPIESKFLLNSNPVQNAIGIWSNKVMINSPEGMPFVILIENKQIAESYRNIFYTIWKSLP